MKLNNNEPLFVTHTFYYNDIISMGLILILLSFFNSLSPPFLTAKDKVALLIGNMNYWEHPKLKAPLVDVYELTNLLRQLDFKVVSLLDLTEYEMRNAVDEFLLLLDKGVYGKIYIIFILIITIFSLNKLD